MGVVRVVVVVTYPVFVGQVAQVVIVGGDTITWRGVAAVVLSVGVGQTVLLVIVEVLLLAHRVIANSLQVAHVIIDVGAVEEASLCVLAIVT